jgi:hypothetical protein
MLGGVAQCGKAATQKRRIYTAEGTRGRGATKG